MPDRYGQLYGPAAVLAFCLSFATLFDDRVIEDLTTRYGSLWEIAGQEDGAPAVLGIVLLLVLVGLLLRATIRPVTSVVVPLGIAALSLAALLMVLTKPGTGSPPPTLADGGAMLAALGGFIVVVAAVHVIDLARRPRP